jgi:hypothetical protein
MRQQLRFHPCLSSLLVAVGPLTSGAAAGPDTSAEVESIWKPHEIRYSYTATRDTRRVREHGEEHSSDARRTSGNEGARERLSRQSAFAQFLRDDYNGHARSKDRRRRGSPMNAKGNSSSGSAGERRHERTVPDRMEDDRSFARPKGSTCNPATAS